MQQLSLRIIQMKKTLRVETFLSEMEAVVPWGELVKVIEPHYPERTLFDIETLLRIHCLQQWYNLSDPAMEEALYDRLSFQRFTGLDGFTDAVPDETTILRFRHLLEAHELTQSLLDRVNAYLMQAGLVVRRGSIVDATVLEAPISKKNEAGARDPEMGSTKKNNKWHFGAKGHIGIQAEGFPLIHSVAFTAANRNDGAMQEALWHGEEKAKFGDGAYARKADKRKARQEGVFYGISEKGAHCHPLSGKRKQRNRKLSSIRAKVEHPFRVIKVLWGHRKLRYRGLMKNASQFRWLCGLSNLFFSRKVLLAMG
jgi:transposase, IS5 family